VAMRTISGLLGSTLTTSIWNTMHCFDIRPFQGRGTQDLFFYSY
jgi:hypothetical protein